MDWIKKRTALRQDHRVKRLLIVLVIVTLGLFALFCTAYVFARLDMRHYDDQERQRTPPPTQTPGDQSGTELLAP